MKRPQLAIALSSLLCMSPACSLFDAVEPPEEDVGGGVDADTAADAATLPDSGTPSEDGGVDADEDDASVEPDTGGVTVEVEAEDMELLEGFEVRPSDDASGGEWIQAQTIGRAQVDFPGPDGTYDLVVVYFDENDGVSTLEATAGSTPAVSWSWDQDLGSPLAIPQTRTECAIRGVPLTTGSRIALSGTADADERMRVDKLVFQPASAGSEDLRECGGDDPDETGMVPVPTLIGFAKGVTGGRGGTVYPITSLSDSAQDEGSVAWALAQGDEDDPRVLLFMVEGAIELGEILKIENSNVTLDGSWAPGAGAWFEGERVEFLGDNILVQHVSFMGNDPTVNPNTDNSNSDSLKLGWREGQTGARDISGLYFRHCAFMHGRDEIFAINPRRNGESTGLTVRNVTIESSVMANAVGDVADEHKFALLLSDGAERITVAQNLFASVEARTPFVREFASEIEVVNNLVYNCRENQTASNSPSVHILGNVHRKGPYSQGTFRPIRLIGGAAKAYVDDNIITNGDGTVVTDGASKVEDSPIFQSSGVPVLASSEVTDLVLEQAGPRRRGVALADRFVAEVIEDARGGQTPAQLPTYPGPRPPLAGAPVLPESEYIPAAYRVLYPNDTSLEQTIQGGPWDGYQVWERVSAWQTQ